MMVRPAQLAGFSRADRTRCEAVMATVSMSDIIALLGTVTQPQPLRALTDEFGQYYINERLGKKLVLRH